jgi:Cu-Zn family superoxide dismutase
MRASTLTALAALVGAASITAAAAQESGQATAAATLVDKEGKEVGKAEFRDTPHGVLIHLSLDGLPPGEKALHIHQNGECDAAGGFESAGGHFNPSSAEHGYLAAKGPHAGDLSSQWVGEDGKLQATVFAPMAAVTADASGNAGEGRFVIAGGGTKTAIVLHEKADDYASQPSGAAGGRLACGVIEAASSSGG